MKICKTCEKEFKPKRKSQIYCSPVCQTTSLRKRVSTTCFNDQCKKGFESKPHENRKYCSIRCAAIVNNTKHPKRGKVYCSYCSTNQVEKSEKYCLECLTILVKKTKEPVELKCLECNVSHLSMVPSKKFCSKSCSNAYQKKYGLKDIGRKRTCPSCKGSKTAYANYCRKCTHEKQAEERINKWLNGEWDGSVANGYYLSETIRKYLLRKENYACESCGFNTPHPKDGSSILEIDHIDGDGTNHHPENLRVLCPNCHALTDTYKARNIGKGRKQYYIRVNKDSIDSLV